MPSTTAPRIGRVTVVGAGLVGLSTAWFLQERGCDVTVLDRGGVAAGSSWGNAGWVAPSLTAPLPEPAVLAYGIKAVLDPASPVYVPVTADPRLLRFLLGFVRHSTHRRWTVGMRAYVAVNRRAIAAFERLTDGGVAAPLLAAEPFLACYETAEQRRVLEEEIRGIEAAGQPVEHELLTGEEARALEPSLSGAVGAAVRLVGQRYLHPPAFVAALADAVRQRGGVVREHAAVRAVTDEGGRVLVDLATGERLTSDAVVLANGAWLSRLARPFGVRLPVQAGRGYSFSVPTDPLPRGPVYLPAVRVACTPLGDRLRVAGMMEFRRPDAPLDPRRIAAIVEAARPFLSGADLDDRADEWVGSRPVTPDGLPVIGPTRSPRVLVAGGHGMWGIALGPVTGELLAERIATGVTPPELIPFDPLR